MLTHIFKSSLRTLYKEKLYTLINIVGLAVALSSCLILGLYLYGELTYDRHHVNHARIFRIANEFRNYDDGAQRRESAMTSPVLAPMLINDFSRRWRRKTSRLCSARVSPVRSNRVSTSASVWPRSASPSRAAMRGSAKPRLP